MIAISSTRVQLLWHNSPDTPGKGRLWSPFLLWDVPKINFKRAQLTVATDKTSLRVFIGPWRRNRSAPGLLSRSGRSGVAAMTHGLYASRFTLMRRRHFCYRYSKSDNVWHVTVDKSHSANTHAEDASTMLYNHIP